MSLVRDGIPASPGIVIAPARVLRWEVPRVPQGATIGPALAFGYLAAEDIAASVSTEETA